ncbi:uncharacterized protein LOC115627343 [Scaptodrosophila lebanonensis]|uniref:Uncharacterized protein LOC115627343 n=1 Tax=Drosophila lebanonensis TaxID=7225 RepID=A0A6J2TS12_DROLE|nr:uncharacterized protein LOC115627343 [Scaptodrosophila lebanonensis]
MSKISEFDVLEGYDQSLIHLPQGKKIRQSQGDVNCNDVSSWKILTDGLSDSDGEVEKPKCIYEDLNLEKVFHNALPSSAKESGDPLSNNYPNGPSRHQQTADPQSTGFKYDFAPTQPDFVQLMMEELVERQKQPPVNSAWPQVPDNTNGATGKEVDQMPNGYKADNTSEHLKNKKNAAKPREKKKLKRKNFTAVAFMGLPMNL